MSIENISKMTLGTFQFTKAWKSKLTKKKIYSILDYSLLKGINSIETADEYDNGQIEKLIGDFKKKIPFVLTKFGQLNNFSEKNSIKMLDNSLRRLNRDHIDIYFFHSGTNKQFNNDKLWNNLQKEVEKGKILNLGLSLKTSLLQKNDYEQIYKMKEYGIKVLQVLYNPIFTEAENIFNFAKKNNIFLMTRSPFAKGLMINNTQLVKIPKTRHKFKILDITKNEFKNKIKKSLGNKSSDNQKLFKKTLKWIFKKKIIKSVICGVSSKQQLIENLN